MSEVNEPLEPEVPEGAPKFETPESHLDVPETPETPGPLGGPPQEPEPQEEQQAPETVPVDVSEETPAEIPEAAQEPAQEPSGATPEDVTGDEEDSEGEGDTENDSPEVLEASAGGVPVTDFGFGQGHPVDPTPHRG